MRLVKLVYTPVDQQAAWLEKANSYLGHAVCAQIHLKDSVGCGEDKTVVIYAIIDGLDRSISMNGEMETNPC